ncbi:MAG: Grx4 family monothiol glutaredoxin [Lysobacteraceae bacterium]
MSATQRIRAQLAAHPVVLFMKGTPEYPMCGCSERAVRALETCGRPFHAVNILADPEIRAQLPRHSNWPTFPQLFIGGELIGGSDITVELHQQGELQQMVAEAVKEP